MKRNTKIAATLISLFALTGCLGPEDVAVSDEALTTGPMHFIGSNGDWFDANSWDSGRVPGPDDDVVIDPGLTVRIDPTRNIAGATGSAPGDVFVRDLHVSSGASFETLPGTTLVFRDFSTVGTASFFAYGSAWEGESALSIDCPRWRCGYNPSSIHVASYELAGEQIEMYLGGTTPAGPGGTGPGHYAAIRGDSVSLSDTDLYVGLRYGFVPSPGDRFVIVEATRELTGTFANFADGDEVARFDGVRLILAYEGNQVVLTAERAPRGTRR